MWKSLTGDATWRNWVFSGLACWRRRHSSLFLEMKKVTKFLQNAYTMLSECTSNVVGWSVNNDEGGHEGFIDLSNKEATAKELLKFYKHGNVGSFSRQLNMVRPGLSPLLFSPSPLPPPPILSPHHTLHKGIQPTRPSIPSKRQRILLQGGGVNHRAEQTNKGTPSLIF